MKKLFLVTAVVSTALLFFQCTYEGKKNPAQEAPVQNEVITKDEENEDGIWESQQMEFELTKDPRLGYVPRHRLVEAYNTLLQARRNNTYARTSALSWAERGPDTDVVGPSNGNLRGPANTAVTAGRLRAIWVDLNDPTSKKVWTGSVSGGLWKTNDITAVTPVWTLVNDFLGNLAVTSITQSPVDKNIMYFGTGERNGNIDAVRGGGVWKSTDNGVTWNLLPNTTGFWNISKIACDASGNLYVGTNGNGLGLQRSLDGGTTWTNITPTTPSGGTRVSEVRISSTGRLHVILSSGNTNSSGYFYTDNPAGVTSASWTSPITPFENVQFNCELSVTGNTLYVLPSNASNLTPQIYKSLDGGATWAATLTSPPGGSSSEPTINSGQGWYNLAIGANPADPNVVIAGGLNFYRSIDGGNTWSQVTRWVGNSFNYVHADHHAVVWAADQVLVATDGGIFYSTDFGANYVDKNVGLRVKQFYSCAIHPATTNYFLGGTQDNGTHQLTNPGLAGSVEVLGGDGGFCHIDEDEPQFQFGSTTRSQYRRSTNGGANWSSVNYSSSVGLFINPTDYDDIENRMYTTGSSGTYVRWENPQSGNTFTVVPLTEATTGTVISIKVSNYTKNRVFFGSSSGIVVKVDNAHATNPVVSDITGAGMPAASISCVNTGTSDNFLIASYSNYGFPHVWASTTGGGAGGWTNITGNLPDIPVRWVMYYPDNNDKAIVATDMGIFETEDINGGATVWVQNGTFPTVRTNMLQYRTSDRTLLAATHGRGLWTTTIPSAAPYIRFASSYTYGKAYGESATGISGCKPFRDYTVDMNISGAPAGSAAVTLSVAAGGNAVEGADFDVTTNGNFSSPSKVLTFPAGSTQKRSFTIRVYDDAEIENEESFVITYSVGGGTNALASPGSQSFTYVITDNDQAPTPATFSGTYSIGTNDQNISTQSLFRSDLARFRIQYLFTAAELTAAGIPGTGNITAMQINVTSKTSTKPYSGFTVAMANSTATNLSAGFAAGVYTEVYNGNYTTVAGANNIVFTTPFVWDGTSNVIVNVCFDNSAGGADFSTDLVEGSLSPLGSGVRVSTYTSPTASGTACSLGASFISELRIKATFSASSGNAIATALSSTKSVNVATNGTYHFYQGFDIISRINNASANLGCVAATIAEAGTVWQSYFAGTRAQKVFDLNFSGNANATYTIGLYYTAAELGGKTPGALNIAKTTATSASGANSSNTTILATTLTSFGTGYLFTATVTGAGKLFLTDGFVTGLFDVRNRMGNFVKLMQNPVSNTIYLDIENQGRTTMAATLFTVKGQMLKKWNLGRASGTVQLPLSGITLLSGTYVLRVETTEKMQSFQLIKQ